MKKIDQNGRFFKIENIDFWGQIGGHRHDLGFQIEGRFWEKIEYFARFGSRVGWWWNPSQTNDLTSHLKQQVSVTQSVFGRQKVHMHDQLSELALLVHFFGR